ncbi:hypothetical protein HG451_002295 [Candidatus Saccharibacteria bacterium]|nr:hypothetical protein [Candidatus Saccharibacteria bacterium]
MSREKHKNLVTRAKIPQNPENLVLWNLKKASKADLLKNRLVGVETSQLKSF